MFVFPEQKYKLITLTAHYPGWGATRENEISVGKINDKLRKMLIEYETESISSIFLHMAYCDFSVAKVKTPIRFSYSAKEKQIRINYFIDYHIFKVLDSIAPELFVEFHEILRLDAIIKGSQKYKIPEENYRELIERRSKLGNIPDWIPEMETNPQLVIDLYKASVPK